MKTRTFLIALTGVLALQTAPAHAALFSVNMHLGPDDLAYEGQDLVVQGCTLTVEGPHRFQSLTLNGATLTHAPAPNAEPSNRIELTIVGDLLVDTTSRIEVSGRGSLAANTLGAAPPTADDGGGGGHGGDGGYAYYGTSEPGGVGGFGSVTTPTSFGGSAAGTADEGYVRCPGGGAVQISVGGTLTLHGQVLANGASWFRNDQGGGAGGSIWLAAGTFVGEGTIAANGGNGESSHGGGGGGGRIALYCGTRSFSGPVLARGGSGRQWGGAGTVFLKALGEPAGTLLIENGSALGARTLLTLPVTASLGISNMAQVMATAPLSLTSLHLGANSLLSHFPTQALWLTVAGDAQIDPGGVISASACGYPLGTNAGPGAAPFTADDGGGGGYGGDGGYAYWGPSEAGGPGGYGSILAPTDFGSAGAGSSDDGLNRTAGGGAVRLMVGGTLSVNGQLVAQGQSAYQNDQGGGAGGSLWLSVGELAGVGLISANGGDGESRHGGGGGGGRIAVYFASNHFTGTLTANGGVGTQYGGAGTLYFKAASEPVGDLILRNNGVSGALTPLTSPEAFRVTLTSGGQAWAPGSFTVASLNVEAGGHLYPAPGAGRLEVVVETDLAIAPGGELSATGHGYPRAANRGPSPGSVGGYCAGGGAYGGNGGVGYNGEAGGLGGYGSLFAPTDFGSAGGTSASGPGGAGGGAIKLTVGGTLTVDGTLTAEGNAAPNNNAGGGAGGSLWLRVGALAGTNRISANGGAGENSDGGGGGGGRIAVFSVRDDFTGLMTACGGTGRQCGGAGTIFRKLSAQTYGLLRCDNQGRSGATTPLSTPQVFGLALAGQAIVYPQLDDSLTVSTLEVGPGAQLTHLNGQRLRLNVLQDAWVQAGGLISANGLGYPVGSAVGPGAGHFGGDTGSGGGYGGAGGHGDEGQAGGNPYGNAGAPLDWGSAGGPGESGRYNPGGGVVSLSVVGTLTVDGTICANGQAAFDNDQGGGSGGSVWLNAALLAGSGWITANGGVGEDGDGGGGAGGRVAVYHQGLLSDPVRITANGASGHSVGEAGTVFLGDPLTNEPPAVIACAPANTVARWVEAVEVTFNTAMDPTTFSIKDVQLTTPAGPLPAGHLSVSALSPQVFRISFPAQVEDGTYTLQVGPSIANTFGIVMTAPFTGTFTVQFPRTLTLAVGPAGLVVTGPTLAGFFYRPQSSVDLKVWADAGNWVAGTGAPLHMTFPTTNAPQQFFRFNLSPVAEP